MKTRFERLASVPARSKGLARSAKRSRLRWPRAREWLHGPRIRSRPPVLLGRAVAQPRNLSEPPSSLLPPPIRRPSAVNFFCRVIAKRSNSSSRKTRSICCEDDCSPSYRRPLAAKKGLQRQNDTRQLGIAAVACAVPAHIIDSAEDSGRYNTRSPA